MKCSNVQRIRRAVQEQAMRATCQVTLSHGGRVIGAKKVCGQLMVRLLGGDKWLEVESVEIR